MKKRVKIYKSPDNKGVYINKTKKFLSKFQMGGGITERAIRDTYARNVFAQLRANMKPEEVYANLLTSGMEKKMAGALMSEVISKMIEAGLFDPQYFENMAKKVSAQGQGQSAPQPAGTPQEMTDLAQSEEPYQEDAYSEGDQEEMMAQDQTSQLSMQEGGTTPAIFDTDKMKANEIYNIESPSQRVAAQGALDLIKEMQLKQSGATTVPGGPKSVFGSDYGPGPTTEGPPPPAMTSDERKEKRQEERAGRIEERQGRRNLRQKDHRHGKPFRDPHQFTKVGKFLNRANPYNWLDPKNRFIRNNPTKFWNLTGQKIRQEGGQTEESQPQPDMSFDQYVDGMQSPIMDIRFPSLSEYINVDNVSWDDLTMMSYGGMTKGKFVKSLLKKQEGGDADTIGTGDRQDTLTNEISKRKSDFTKTLKDLSTKALGEEIYDNANKLGDPKVMEMADGLIQEENSEMPKAQKGKIIKDALKVYKDLQPVKNFNKISKPELKRLQQIRGLIRDKNFMTTANDTLLKKKLNSAKTSHVLDEDLQVLYPGMQSKEGILRAIAQGRGPLQSAAADLDYANTPLTLENVRAIAEASGGDLPFSADSNLSFFNELTPEQAVKRFQMLMKDPTGMSSQGMEGFESLGIPSKNVVPSLYAHNYRSPAALAEASKLQMADISQLPIGSLGTGSDNLTLDSKLMQDGHFSRMLQNPEAYGIFENPIFTGYNRLQGEDFLTDGYWGKKMYDEIYDLKFKGLNDAEIAKAEAKIVGDTSKLRRDYYMTNQENMMNLTGQDFGYPVLEYKPGSMSADQVPKDLPSITRRGMLESNFGLGLKEPKTTYDWVAPHFSLGKIRQEGGEMEDIPMAQRGGAAYKVAKAFMDAGAAEENAVDPWEGYPIRQATINYNRQSVPYGTFTGRRGRLRDMLFPANRMFGRMPYIKTKTDYTGPMDALTPLRREVTKTNWRGRPKKWTDYYTTGSGSGQSNELQDQIDARNEATQELISFDPSKRQVKQAKRQAFDDQYGDMKLTTRNKIRRGERRSDRADRRAERNPKGIVPFLAGSPIRKSKKAGKITRSNWKFNGGGFTSNMGVNAPQPNTAVNPDAEITNLDPNQGMMGGMGAFMNNNIPDMPYSQPDNITVDPNQAVDPIQENFDDYQYGKFKPGKDDPSEIVKMKRKAKLKTKVTDGEALVNTGIAGIRGLAGIKSRFNTKNDYADYNDEMTRPENLYANTVKTYKGEEADIAGRQLGLKNFDKMGQMDYTGMNTSQYGGFMQEGGYMDQFEEDGEYELPEELIEYLLANGVELDFI